MVFEGVKLAPRADRLLRHDSPLALNVGFYVLSSPNIPGDMVRKRSPGVHEDSRVEVQATPRKLSLLASGERSKVF